MRRIIYSGPEFCAVVEDGILVEYLQNTEQKQAGDILLGKVERMMPGLGCAFVDIGRKRSGFLPLSENSLSFVDGDLRSGMIVPVQIRKEETGEKGVFLTRDITLAGRYVLCMPKNRYIGVSSRILKDTEKNKLREIGKAIAGSEAGIVMRASSLDAETEDIRQEYYELSQIWEAVCHGDKMNGRAGTVLYHQDPVMQLLSDYSTSAEEMIKVSELPPAIEKQLSASKERIVRMPNGGTIVIDRCEALTVIDVNTASSCPDSTKEMTFLETNLAACNAAAAQIRLRNLTGIILIDFIDMDSESDRQCVGNKLSTLLKSDRRKTVLHGWTRLGLMEMTRKRT